jgi:hypothetical protein
VHEQRAFESNCCRVQVAIESCPAYEGQVKEERGVNKRSCMRLAWMRQDQW